MAFSLESETENDTSIKVNRTPFTSNWASEVSKATSSTRYVYFIWIIQFIRFILRCKFIWALLFFFLSGNCVCVSSYTGLCVKWLSTGVFLWVSVTMSIRKIDRLQMALTNLSILMWMMHCISIICIPKRNTRECRILSIVGHSSISIRNTKN